MSLTRILLLLLVATPLVAAPIDTAAIGVSGGQSQETWHGQATVRAVDLELTRAFSPRTEVSLLVSSMQFDQPRNWFGDQYGDGHEDVRALSSSLLLRRRFNVDSPHVQFYGEASSGPMWAEKPVPAATSRFNFVTGFGAGIVLMPKRRASVFVGYRFMHVSNGGYSPRNPGLNISSVVLGVRYRQWVRRASSNS